MAPADGSSSQIVALTFSAYTCRDMPRPKEKTPTGSADERDTHRSREESKSYFGVPGDYDKLAAFESFRFAAREERANEMKGYRDWRRLG
jgi:hypothetical protein